MDAYGNSFLARMMRSTRRLPPEAPLRWLFCQDCTQTTRGQASPSHQAKKGPPDWPGQTSPRCQTARWLEVSRPSRAMSR